MLKRKGAGFTLIEVLVVLGLILFLTTLSLPYYRANQSQSVLLQTSYKFAQDIRKAQEAAMSAKECEPCGGGVPPGYGIYLQQGNDDYLFYADDSPAQGNQKYAGGDTVIATISLGAVRIQNVSPASVSINFKPPDPIIRIGNGSNPDMVIITLALKADTTKTKNIIVNKYGLIDVE